MCVFRHLLDELGETVFAQGGVPAGGTLTRMRGPYGDELIALTGGGGRNGRFQLLVDESLVGVGYRNA